MFHYILLEYFLFFFVNNISRTFKNMNWIKNQIIKCINWLDYIADQLTDFSIDNIRDIIVNNDKNSLILIKKYLDIIVKLQGMSKYKTFQYVFDRLELTESEIKEYALALRDWFNS